MRDYLSPNPAFSTTLVCSHPAQVYRRFAKQNLVQSLQAVEGVGLNCV
jgi:hypothetical protein